MKKLLFIFTLILPFIFASCSDDDVNDLNKAVQEVYFSPSNPTTLELSASETSFSVGLLRTITTEALSVPVAVSGNDDGFYTIPASAEFVAGSDNTELVITYDPETVGYDNHTTLTFSVDYTASQGATIHTVEVWIPSPYTLRYLTFEDSDYKGSGEVYWGETGHSSNYWSTLIDSPQYYGGLLYNQSHPYNLYGWYDEGNTELESYLPNSWGDYCYWGGGHAISNYGSSNITTYGTYEYQLTVYDGNASEEITTTGHGNNGSNNFAVDYGYIEGSYASETSLPYIDFADGVARVIDHMYIAPTTYLLNNLLIGDSFSSASGDSDWLGVTAMGYDASDTKVGELTFYIFNGKDSGYNDTGETTVVKEWTKWDLSELGEVVTVRFQVYGSQVGTYGFSAPAYFAYDDVAVRFPNE